MNQTVLVIVGIMVLALATGCGGDGASTGPTSVVDDPLDLAQIARPGPMVEDLNETEIANLLHMREEEKLAHDAYALLFGLWEEAVFERI